MHLNVIFLVALSVTTCLGQGDIIHSFEFEDFVAESQTDFWRWRSNASRNKTLRLEDEFNDYDYRLHLKLCVAPEMSRNTISVRVNNIIYSNDGSSDMITVNLDSQSFTAITVGEFGSGFLWNRFLGTGNIGNTVQLAAGNHTLTVSVQTDVYGVELDFINIATRFQDPATRLICESTFSTAMH